MLTEKEVRLVPWRLRNTRKNSAATPATDIPRRENLFRVIRSISIVPPTNQRRGSSSPSLAETILAEEVCHEKRPTDEDLA